MFEKEKIKLTAIVVSLIIFLAYIKQYLYYIEFGIDISNYISINEVFTSFIDDLAIWAICLLVTLALLFSILSYITNFLSNNSIDNNEKPTGNFIDIITNINRRYLIMLLCLYTFFVYYTFNGVLTILFVGIINIIVGLSLLIVITKKQYIIKFKENNPIKYDDYKFLYFIFIAFSITSLFTCYMVFKDIKNKFSEYKIKTYVFRLNNDTIIQTNSNILYLGRTDKFLFILNRNTNKQDSISHKIDVYNNSIIEKEEIKINRLWN